MLPFNHLERFIRDSRKRILGLRHSALVEMLLALTALILFDILLGDHTRYWSVNPHPFLFIVLLMACKYGMREAFVATIISSALLLIGNLPAQSITQDRYAYMFSLMKLPMLWLGVSVIFGGLRQMHMRERDDLETALIDAETREHQIADAYERVKEAKDRFELRMAGQLRSSISAFHAARAMESLSPGDILKGLEELVRAALHCEQFSIYLLDQHQLNLTLAHGWGTNEKYLRQFDHESSLYKSIIIKQKTLCVANAEHQRQLAGQGLLAGPLLDSKSGEVIGMLKIEHMDFSDLHLTTIETFSAICEWAALALLNAQKYQKTKETSIINPEHQLFTRHYLRHYIEYISMLAKRAQFDLTRVTVTLQSPEQFSKEEHINIARLLADAVNSVLRHIDLAFEGQDDDAAYSLLLPATNVVGAATVLEKLRTALAERLPEYSDRFLFNVEVIYAKPDA